MRPQGIENARIGIHGGRENRYLATYAAPPHLKGYHYGENGQYRYPEAPEGRLGVEEYKPADDENAEGEEKQDGIHGDHGPRRVVYKLELGHPTDTDLPALAKGNGLYAVRERIGGIVVHYLEARYDVHVQAVDGFGQIPLGPEIAERHFVSDRRERRPTRGARICNCVHQHAGADIVVHHRETVAPALQRIAHITVDDHVLRQAFQPQPLVGRLVQCACDVTVEHGHTVIHRTFEPVRSHIRTP